MYKINGGYNYFIFLAILRINHIKCKYFQLILTFERLIMLAGDYNQFMKRDHAKDLRYSEKIKETQCFIQADSLLKKIRKFDAGKEQPQKKTRPEDMPCIDAQIKMREIEYFWKEGWEYDHTHPTFMEPRITIPSFYIEGNDCHEMLVNYYELLKKFVTKLKIQHEDQTVYRIKLLEYPYKYNNQPQNETIFYKTAENALEHLIRLFKNITREMKYCFDESKAEAGELMMEDLDPACISSLNFVNSIYSLITEEGMNQQHPNKRFIQLAYSQTAKFMSFMTEKLLDMKQKNMCAQIIAVQPYLGELTYILHPLCYSLYSLFSHEQLIRFAQKRRGKVYDEQLEKNPLVILHDELNYTEQLLHIQDNLRIEEYRHSKIILLNLDGYESEFNLQFLRNFSDHVMYISFPKHESKVNDQAYNSRFYKKLMFNFTKSELDLFSCDQDDQAFTQTLKREELLQNPEKYHQIVNQMYLSSQAQDQVDDFNKNLYVFPLNINALKPQNEQSKRSGIQGNQSYFIRYLFRNHLFSEMLKFKPKMILISYSGRIKIENQHFLEILQQTSKICPRLLFLPNLTTALIRQTMNNYFDNFETMPAYDKVFTDIGSQIISSKNENQTLLQKKLESRYKDLDYNPDQVDLLDKLSIFSKVAAGHYNLNRVFQEQKLQVKLRNCRVFDYVIDLFAVLKDQYEHCKKRMQPQALKAAKSILERGLSQYSKQLQQCVPMYFKRVFQSVEKILFSSQLTQQQQLRAKNYQLQLEQLREIFQEDQILRHQWSQLKKIQALSAANNKYHQVSYLQIHTAAPKQQFTTLLGEKMNNLNNTIKISFCDKSRNTEIIKIYKEATIHYQPYQRFRQKSQYFNIVLTNMLNLQETNYQNYAARGKTDKKFQRCQITPIQFYNKEGVPFQLPPFMSYTQWNYAQTENYVILYWPQLFDHIAYYLHKLLNKTYRTFIQHRIFVSVKNVDMPSKLSKVRFSEVNLAESNVIPRWGCSVLFIQDQIFIFGGFHQTQKSYLDLQNQITTLDLSEFKDDPLQPRKLFNLRKQLYCGEVFNGHLRQKRKPSSFVRPRMEFQFYNYDDLDLDQKEIQKEGFIRFVMIGGYGQDFKTPYSLFVNYYYIITYDTVNRRIFSIEKRNVPNKVIPINVKGVIKNRGLFNKANILDQRGPAQSQQRNCREGITNNNHYFSHRIIYSIKDGQLQSKIKNFYALEVFQNCKQQFRNFAEMIGEVRAVEEGEIVQIKKMDKTNHHLLVQINQSLYLYSLFLQIRGQTLQEVPLTNQSIISLDAKKLNVFALVSHHKYTHNQTYLTTQTLLTPSTTLIKRQQHYALVLKQLWSFPYSLHLHCLIACNEHDVALLQGLGIRGNCRSEYLVRGKSKNSLEIKRQQILPPVIDIDEGETLITFFYKKNNIITSINFLISSNHEYLIMIKQTLDLIRFSEGWKGEINQQKRINFIFNGNKIKIQKIELRLQNYGLENLVLKIMSQKRQGSRGYSVKLNRLADQAEQVEVSSISREEQLRLNNQQVIPSVIKTHQKYMDYEYMSNEL